MNNEMSLITKNKGYKNGSFKGYLKRNLGLYLLLIPGILYLLVFKYTPMYGLVIAFKDYDIFAGSNPLSSIINSQWVGIKNFIEIFGNKEFLGAFKNTLEISLLKIIIVFPLPIIFAILLNEVRNIAFKKVVQTVAYLPHFLSWIIVYGLFLGIFGSGGTVNEILKFFTGKEFQFFMDNNLFRGILVFTDAWKGIGWSSIIYLAAITSIDQELYEAAMVDGASKFQQILHITLPGLASTIVILLIMRVGSILDAGFDQIFVMYNPTVYEKADIIGTYIYRTGLGELNFSRATTVGLFNSVIGAILVFSTNILSKKLTGKSIW